MQSANRALTEQQLKSNQLKLIWGLILLIAPTALGVISLVAYIALNVAFEAASVSGLLRTVPTVIFSIINIVVILSWLPGIVIGIVLLATRKHTYVKN